MHGSGQTKKADTLSVRILFATEFLSSSSERRAFLSRHQLPAPTRYPLSKCDKRESLWGFRKERGWKDELWDRIRERVLPSDPRTKSWYLI
jgi:hypothetical protein